LAGGIAHEINNPLGGILVFSQMILREMSPQDKHYTDVEEILNATERCKAIVENLLEFARQSPSRTPEKAEQSDLMEALDTALRFVKLGLNDKNIEVEWEKNITESLIAGDKNKVIQLFLNLMQNSVQAMSSGGILTMKLYNETHGKVDYIVCEVKDTGEGIPAKVQKKVFDPFYTTKDPGEGTGLGLAICYGIVEELGGKISLTSKEGVGSAFKVLIPVLTESEKKSA
jgi:two-component system NtrC family sensor kinase